MTEPTSDWGRGSWMQTFTGRQFYPLAPRAEDVDPVDIAHALSLICRYGGHTRRFYSVAEHCVLMSHVVPAEHALKALLHDATEAYVGDMIRPLKHQIPQYQQIELLVWSAITRRFGISIDMPAAVKEADNRILLDERAALLSPPPADWAVEDLQPLGVQIHCWSPDMAELMYTTRLQELAGLAGHDFFVSETVECPSCKPATAADNHLPACDTRGGARFCAPGCPVADAPQEKRPLGWLFNRGVRADG